MICSLNNETTIRFNLLTQFVFFVFLKNDSFTNASLKYVHVE